MSKPKASSTAERTALMRPLRMRIFATRCVMVWERLVRCFWPSFSLLAVLVAAFLWGLFAAIPPIVGLMILVCVCAGLVYWMWRGVRAFSAPSDSDIYHRLDKTLNGSPVTSLADELAIGQNDADTQSLWALHIQRMSERANMATVPESHIRLAKVDPYGLRLLALLALVSGMFFAQAPRERTLEHLTGRTAVAKTGTSFEAWAKPPLYTGLPTVYLNDVEAGTPISLAEGSEFLVRVYGDPSTVTLRETLSVTGTSALPVEEGVLSEVSFHMVQSGLLELSSAGAVLAQWDISVLSDLPPMIEVTADMTRDLQGAMQLPFRVFDDYGVTGGALNIQLDLGRVDRRYGLALEPEQVPALTGTLPLPFNKRADDFEGTIEEDFAQHVWAGLPVIVNLSATDAAGNEGRIAPLEDTLAFKRFFDPLAAALIDVRRQLLWNRENAERAIYLLRAISHEPEGSFSQNKAYLMTRTAIRRMENIGTKPLSNAIRDEVSELLWNAAILIEDGDLNDAKERLRRAQERLAEAMENGATEDEIAELMDELRDATRDYMRELAENAEESDQQQSSNQQGESVTQDQIQEMMDRIQELMDQGRMDEAQALLQQLQEMLDNMRIVRQEGQGGEGEGQPQDMQDMLQEQQDLADETFRELQEEFDQAQRQSEQEAQQQQGREGQQQGQSGQQQQGQQGQSGQPQQGEQGQSGQQQGQSQGQGDEGDQQAQGQGQGQQEQGVGQSGTEPSDLAGRQRALRDMLNQQRRGLPNDGSEAGNQAAEAFDDAENQMGQAEDNLRQGDLGGALDQQSEALESLRRGMRALNQQQQRAQNGETGEQQDGFGNAPGQDPLGRPSGQDNAGSALDDDAQNEGLNQAGRREAYENLLEDLKGRAQDRTRPEYELDYLERLLDRF